MTSLWGSIAPSRCYCCELCGEQDKYWDMHGVLMANQTKLSDSDLAGFAQGIGVDMDKWTACLSNPAQEAEVRKDMVDASAVGVTGTPAFFINGVLLSGAVPLDQFNPSSTRNWLLSTNHPQGFEVLYDHCGIVVITRPFLCLVSQTNVAIWMSIHS